MKSKELERTAQKLRQNLLPKHIDHRCSPDLWNQIIKFRSTKWTSVWIYQFINHNFVRNKFQVVFQRMSFANCWKTQIWTHNSHVTSGILPALWPMSKSNPWLDGVFFDRILGAERFVTSRHLGSLARIPRGQALVWNQSSDRWGGRICLVTILHRFCIWCFRWFSDVWDIYHESQ